MTNQTSAWGDSAAAEAWRRSAAARGAALAEATERMLERARLRPGARVLDAGAGTGDTAITAALRVGPTGTVVATDISEAMLALAAASAREAGLANVEVRVMDLGRVDLPAASFDAVIARHSLMFPDDPAAALAGLRRVLRPGGRLAATVWAPLERNPSNAAAIEVARSFGPLPSPPPDMLKAFSFGTEESVAAKLAAAGFAEVLVEPVPIVRRFPSLAAVFDGQRDAGPTAHLFAHLSPPDRAAAWAALERAYAPFAKEDGAIAIPGETLVASATA